MGNGLQSLETLYLFLTTNLSALLATCQNQDQRAAITSLYVASRRSYWNCINKTFHDDDPAVASLVSQLQAAQDRLQATTQGLASVADAISEITEAVKVAAQLAATVG
jgi:hypothetical protein